jgi:hypothetical protein
MTVKDEDKDKDAHPAPSAPLAPSAPPASLDLATSQRKFPDLSIVPLRNKFSKIQSSFPPETHMNVPLLLYAEMFLLINSMPIVP